MNTPQLDRLLADGRVRLTNPGELTPLYETIHPPKPRRAHRVRRQARHEPGLRHTSPWTKPSLRSRVDRRRAASRAARRARRANR